MPQGRTNSSESSSSSWFRTSLDCSNVSRNDLTVELRLFRRPEWSTILPMSARKAPGHFPHCCGSSLLASMRSTYYAGASGRSPAWRCSHLRPAPSPCATYEGEAYPAARTPELSKLHLPSRSVRYVQIFLCRGRRLDSLWRSTGSPLTSVSSRRFTGSSFHCTEKGVSTMVSVRAHRLDCLVAMLSTASPLCSISPKHRMREQYKAGRGVVRNSDGRSPDAKCEEGNFTARVAFGSKIGEPSTGAPRLWKPP